MQDRTVKHKSCLVLIGLLFPQIIFFVLTSSSYAGAIDSTIKRVESDQSKYVSRYIVIEGKLDVSNYYNWKYTNSKKSHYAFMLDDGSGTAFLYGKKSYTRKLRDLILDKGKPVRGKYYIKILKKKFDPYADHLHAELVKIQNVKGY